MAKSVVSEGRTTNEAIENGLKILKVQKKYVDVKVLDNDDKRSFFSILAPRVVKVELTLKDNIEENQNDKKDNIKKDKIQKKEIVLTEEEIEKATKNIEEFLREFISNFSEKYEYSINEKDNYLYISLDGDNLEFLIGYRGETLYAMQNILSAIGGKGIQNKVRVILDVKDYKEKREKTLEDLANKVAKTVIRTRKPVKLEPMKAYERKIIHSKLQENPKVETISVGEEPYRRIVVSLKSNRK